MKQAQASGNTVLRKKNVFSRMLAQWDLQILLVPGILLVLLFSYVPMYGVVMGFQDFQLGDFPGFSQWVGFKHFQTMFADKYFGLAMRNTLHLDPDYVAAHPERNLPTELRLREGSQVVLYMPSRVVGSGGVSGDGGYEGQSGYTLDARRPFIVTMTICDTVKNPLEHEGREVDEFCKTHNGGLKMYDKDDDTADIGPLPSDPEDKNHPYNVTEEWVSANDTIPQVYINYRFNPAKKGLKFPDPYSSGFLPYADASSMETLETKINEALVKRFHPISRNWKPTR